MFIIVTSKESTMAQKKILFLTTGGTIASVAGENGLTPMLGAEIVRNVANIFDCSIVSKELFRLDSSNIQPEEWQILAKEIHEQIAFFEGIVVTHGTDTMAYTAAILSYILQGVPIPIVLTGSQLPEGHALTDATDNLHTAFSMACSQKAGIYIAFARKIILGTRAVKAKTRSFDAFESINLPYIAQEDARGLIFNTLPFSRPNPPYTYRPSLNDAVFLLKLIPGTPTSILPMLAELGYKGIVIEAFGAGGLHVLRRNLVEEIRKLTEKDISVVVVSQCLYEPSDFTLYEVGRQALLAGVIEGKDMTSEAAVTKLMWALGNYVTPEEIRAVFNTSLAGEITL